MIKKLLSKSIVVFYSIYYIFSGVSSVFAYEVVIEGNGGGSQNEVTASVDQTTTVTQNNTATVDNETNSSSNTGSNTASADSSDTAIVTGSTSSNTEITNTLNTSTVDTGCCQTSNGNSISISGNGTESVNEANSNNSNTNITTVTQNATIKNTITILADTGNNTILNSGGATTISTGDISVTAHITNAPVNTSYIAGGSVTSNGTNYSVFQNGVNSLNTLSLGNTTTNVTNISNTATIDNVAYFNLNTGKNKVLNSLGDVAIITGTIDMDFTIENSANVNFVSFTCCHSTVNPPADSGDPSDPRDPSDTPATGGTSTPSDPSNSPSNSSSTGQILAEAAATYRGGLDILGLSNTGGGKNISLIFFGIVLLTSGFYIISRNLPYGDVSLKIEINV